MLTWFGKLGLTRPRSVVCDSFIQLAESSKRPASIKHRIFESDPIYRIFAESGISQLLLRDTRGPVSDYCDAESILNTTDRAEHDE